MIKRFRLRTSLLVLATATVFVGCGESTPSESSESSEPSVLEPSSPTATNGSDADTSVGVSSSTPTAAASTVGEPFAALGAATGLVTAANDIGVLNAVLTGRGCAADGLFGSCRGATGPGGSFIVSAHNDATDMSVWTIVVRCGVAPAMPVASIKAKQLLATADLNLQPYGEVIGIGRHADAGSEAFLVYQPEGESCPLVYGLGAIKPHSIMTGGTDVVGVRRPDDSLACVRADIAAGFIVAEAQSDC